MTTLSFAAVAMLRFASLCGSVVAAEAACPVVADRMPSVATAAPEEAGKNSRRVSCVSALMFQLLFAVGGMLWACLQAGRALKPGVTPFEFTVALPISSLTVFFYAALLVLTPQPPSLRGKGGP